MAFAGDRMQSNTYKVIVFIFAVVSLGSCYTYTPKESRERWERRWKENAARQQEERRQIRRKKDELAREYWKEMHRKSNKERLRQLGIGE